jgi:glycosyltransferase involved in cell wall biosynthesis
VKIVIAAVASSAHLSGVSRHAANMARCLLGRAEVSAVHLVVAQWQYDSMLGAVHHCDPRLHIHPVSIGQSVVGRNLWYYIELPRLAAQLEAEVVHLAYPSPVNRRAFDCPVVVTLHDLYPHDIPANFGYPKVLLNRAILWQCLRAVDAIACVSESTSQRLAIYSPRLIEEKAVTVYNCIQTGFAVAEKGPVSEWEGEPFLLCVAQHRRNKNVVFTMRVFERLLRRGEINSATRLVIIGIEGPETPRIHRFIRDRGLARQVVLLHGIDDAELHWCYRHCELLLSPSIIEGFGLPVVEAMLHRCTVVCSDIPAFREIGGSHCHYSALTEEAFVDATCKALKSVKLRAVDVERFSDGRVAEAYLQLYTRLRNRCPVVVKGVHYAATPAGLKGRP